MIGTYKPDYVIKDCGNNGIYKVIRFKRGSSADYIKFDDEADKTNLNKLDNNICRAKSTVLELALCNEWEWFVTLTLDPKKYDRNDLDKYAKDLSQWVRNQRKKYKTKFQYLLIPEQHKDGAWHMHGLMNGIPYYEIENFKKGIHPEKLVRSGYYNFPAYNKRFGFCSLGRIRDKARCAFYISKYISKDLSKRLGALNEHLYYATQKMNRYENASYLYGDCPELDKLLVNHNEFCSTGYVFGESELFPVRYECEIPGQYKEKSQQKERQEDEKETAFLFVADVITENDLIKLY